MTELHRSVKPSQYEQNREGESKPPTGHTLVESTLFPHNFYEIWLNQRGIDVELM